MPPDNAGSATLMASVNTQHSMDLDLMSPELQIYHNHDLHTSGTDEDEDGGVSIPPNTTLYHPPPHISNTHNDDIDMDFAEQTSSTAAASSISTPGEASLGTAIHSAWSNIPSTAAMSQLSQQLEQIQEAQGNEAAMGLLGHIESVHFNSIPPTLPYSPPISMPSAGFGGGGGGDDDDMEEMIVSSDNSSVPIVPQTIDTSQLYPPPMAEMHNATAPDILPPFAHWDPQSTIDFAVGEVTFLSNADLELIDQVDVDQNSYTLSMYDFLWTWGHRASRGHLGSKKRAKGPELGSLDRQRRDTPKEIRRCDLQGDQCDIQGMNWLDMEVTRREAREARQLSYKNYESIRFRAPYHSEHMKSKSLPVLPNLDNFLRFRRMDLQHKPHLSHFQLRNLIACTSRSNVFYAGRNKVHYSNPLMGTSSTVMDLTDPDVQPVFNLHPTFGGVQISTIASKHGILLAGGFNGEYAMINLNSPKTSGHLEGLITDHPNSITNHISLSLSRSSGLPQAAFASNDNGIRVLDCTTNTFNASHTYSFPVNCTAISPDSRLRVIVGDTKSVHICDTETGKILQELQGHSDFGFACAWADNGWHVATGNQDMTVKVWDARMWTDRYGAANPLKTIGSELAGVRSLQFSPLGSGKRILLACEAADVIDVIDGESYESKQVLDFFGEIGGACFTPDGQDVFVANCDSVRGGIIEFERTGEGARLGYRISRKDVDQLNRNISRKETRAWLDDDRGRDRNRNDLFKSTNIAKPGKPSSQAIDYARDIAESYGIQWEYIVGTASDDAEVIRMIEIFEKNSFRKDQPIPRPVHPFERLQSTSAQTFQQKALVLGEQQHHRQRGWDTNDEDILDSEDDGYTSIEEQMRQQAQGYDWRQTDAQLTADSRSNNRTQTWRRRKHLFGTGNSEPLGGMTFSGGEHIDLGL